MVRVPVQNLDLGPNVANVIEKRIESTNVNEISALEVINELGGLPLALDQFTLYLKILPFEDRNLQSHLKILKKSACAFSPSEIHIEVSDKSRQVST